MPDLSRRARSLIEHRSRGFCLSGLLPAATKLCGGLGAAAASAGARGEPAASGGLRADALVLALSKYRQRLQTPANNYLKKSAEPTE